MSDIVKSRDDDFLERFQSLPSEKKLEVVVAALKESEKQKEFAVQRAERNEEKAKTLDRVMTTERWLSMQEAAAILGYKKVGQNNLFSFLRSEGILMNTANRWNIPYREYEERGYFKVNEYDVDLGNGEFKKTLTTRVSQKGLDFIRRRLSERENDNPIEE